MALPFSSLKPQSLGKLIESKQSPVSEPQLFLTSHAPSPSGVWVAVSEKPLAKLDASYVSSQPTMVTAWLGLPSS